jgi:transcriptional regulator with XRE-family HTH domain
MLREDAGLTQAELAERVDININTLATYERETREPNIEKICLFARFFGVSSDFLLGRSTERIPDSDVQSAAKLIGFSDSVVRFLKECPSEVRRTLDCLLSHPGTIDFLRSLMVYVYSLDNAWDNEASEIISYKLAQRGNQLSLNDVGALVQEIQWRKVTSDLLAIAGDINIREGRDI